MKYMLSLVIIFLSVLYLDAQITSPVTTINGRVLPYMVDENGDTLILARLDGVTVSSFREFKDREEYNQYNRYRRYAAKVYPYAVDAIRIFREVEAETENFKKKRHKKKFIRQKQKELEKEFEEPLKNLTKTQGKVLIKMIEKELDIPLYFLIKELRSGFVATKWSTVGRLYGHNLRKGYTVGEDPILDAVLNDMDISAEKRTTSQK